MGLGLTGIRGIGGLGGSSMSYQPGNVGGLSYAPQNSSEALFNAPSSSQRGAPPQQGPSALSQLSSGVGMANTANRVYEGLGGEATGLGGSLGGAGNALGSAGSLSRVMSGNGSPMDYANLAKMGYNAYNSGALASAATNGSAYSSLASAAEGAEATGGGLGAGMSAYALPAAVVLAGIMGWNEPGMSNEQKLGTIIGSQGGTQGFLNKANSEISALDPSNYSSLADKSVANYKEAMARAANQEGSSGYTPQPMENIMQQLQYGTLGGGFGGSSILEQALNPKLDPSLLAGYIGTDRMNDLRNRFTTARTNAMAGTAPLLQSRAAELSRWNPYSNYDQNSGG